MKNALAPAKAMMVAAAVEMSVNRMLFPFVLYGEGCPAILFMAGTFVSGYSALLASVETDQNHYDQCDCRDDVCVADIFSSSI